MAAASSADWQAESLVTNLLALEMDELLDLLLTIAATSIGDWVSSEKDETLGVNGLTALVAEQLGIKGHECWKLEEEYLKFVGHVKGKLLPYLGAVGIGQPEVFADLPARNLRLAIFERREKLDPTWCPRELEITLHSGQMQSSDTGEDAAENDEVSALGTDLQAAA